MRYAPVHKHSLHLAADSLKLPKQVSPCPVRRSIRDRGALEARTRLVIAANPGRAVDVVPDSNYGCHDKIQVRPQTGTGHLQSSSARIPGQRVSDYPIVEIKHHLLR